MSNANRGKGFANEFWHSINDFAKQAPLWDHGFDNVGHYLGPKRPADRIVLHEGKGWLIELKEVNSKRLSFDAILEHQHTALSKASKTGNLALVVVKCVQEKLDRVFAYDYRGIELEQSISPAKSIHLLDSSKNVCVDNYRVELLPKTTAGNRAIWDVATMFRRFA